MQLLPDYTRLFSLPNSTPEVCIEELTVIDTEIKEQEALLYKIAISFGFIDSDAIELVQQVYYNFNKHYADLQSGTSLKTNLSKILVHQCIFKISSQLLSQNMHLAKIRATAMPLSAYAVFILHNNIGFIEYEIAEILNINVLQVKQRLNKALLFINHRQ